MTVPTDHHSSSPPLPPRASVILSSCPLSSGLFSEHAPSTACATCAAGLHTEAHTDGAGQTRAVSHQNERMPSMTARGDCYVQECVFLFVLHRDFAWRACARHKDADLRTTRTMRPYLQTDVLMEHVPVQQSCASHLRQVKFPDAKLSSKVLGDFVVEATDLYLAIKLLHKPVCSVSESLRIWRCKRSH